MGQMREMEEVIHRQCMELRGWREQYLRLDRSTSAEVFKRLREEIATLRQSNDGMERQLDNMRSSRGQLASKVDELMDEVYALRNRGLFARIFNL